MWAQKSLVSELKSRNQKLLFICCSSLHRDCFLPLLPPILFNLRIALTRWSPHSKQRTNTTWKQQA